MTSVNATPPARKPEPTRTLKLGTDGYGRKVLTITITTPRKTKEAKVEVYVYVLGDLGADADGNRGFRVVKIAEPATARKDDTIPVYDLLAGPDGSVTCDCRGSTAHNHCRHADAVAALLSRNLL